MFSCSKGSVKKFVTRFLESRIVLDAAGAHTPSSDTLPLNDSSSATSPSTTLSHDNVNPDITLIELLNQNNSIIQEEYSSERHEFFEALDRDFSYQISEDSKESELFHSSFIPHLNNSEDLANTNPQSFSEFLDSINAYERRVNVLFQNLIIDP